ncbi:DUF624 domain-containing protein [Fictibacillus sp. B-59209]|uniref:YesL family protein n=1 Tax=Fictibacillus sp. B-59209 TaxID=3024873 RepID=UPI002E216E6F|nr:DUF624 domain-containing protein [Fictibacillus sp. B-59209]
MEKGYIGKLYHMCEWVMRIAYLNILWLAFTLAGFVLFGLFPSTIAMYTVTRKWVQGNTDIKLFHLFWQTYRKELFKSQKIGLVLMAALLLFVLDYKFYMNQTSTALVYAKIIWFACVVLFGTFNLYFFPVYVHYQCKPLQYIKNVFLIAVMFPLHSFLLWCGALFILLFIYNFQGLSLFFSSSVLAFWITLVTHNVFSKINVKGAVQEGRSLTIGTE